MTILEIQSFWVHWWLIAINVFTREPNYSQAPKPEMAKISE